MRSFTAIELPAPIRTHLADIQSKLRTLPQIKDATTWTREDNLHLTLKFLGDVPDATIPALTRALATLPVPTMTFTIDRFLVLPGQGPARVLSATLAGDLAPLTQLFNQIESACQPLGFSRENRAFKPHITLARFKRPSNQHTAQSLIRIVDPALLPTPAFTVNQFVLFQSELNPAGSIYTPLAHFPPAS